MDLAPGTSLKLTLAGDYQDVDQDFSYRPVAGFPPIGQPRVQGFRDGDQDAPSRYRFRYGGVSIKADAELGAMTFMSLSALRRMHARYGVGPGPGPQAPYGRLLRTREQKQFSQEFQLQSSETSPVRWTAGLYYIHIEERYDPTDFRYRRQLFGQARRPDPADPVQTEESASSYAAYGQGTLPIGQATRLTLGLRYTIEHRSVEANGERLFDNPPFVRPIPGLPLLTEEPFRNSNTFRELTWRASLDRHFSDEVMGYLIGEPGLPERRLEPPDSAESRLRAGKARRLRSRIEICRSLATLPGGCEHLLL